MCPEAVISKKGKSKIESWIRTKASNVLCDPDEGALKNAGGLKTFIVGGEPLVIYSRPLATPIRMLYCSDKQAKELERLQIVRFQKPAKRKGRPISNEGLNKTLEDNRGCA